MQILLDCPVSAFIMSQINNFQDEEGIFSLQVHLAHIFGKITVTFSDPWVDLLVGRPVRFYFLMLMSNF